MASTVRLYSRLVLVGFWSLLFGGVVVVLVAQTFSMLATASPAGTGSTVGVPIGELAQRSLLPLFAAGVAGVGVGLVLVVLGVVLLRSMLAAPGR